MRFTVFGDGFRFSGYRVANVLQVLDITLSHSP